MSSHFLITLASTIDISPLPKATADQASIENIIQIVIGILGALAVLFIVIGGFRYILSRGDAQAVSKAKNTIMYAIIGLLLAIFAEFIVGFVAGSL